MKLQSLLLSITFIIIGWGTIYAQNSSDTRSKSIENKLGAEFNIPLGKNGKHILSPSIRSVFSDHRKSDNISSYTGNEVELCYTYSPWSFMSFSADAEVDFTRGGETILCAYLSANPKYTYKRFTVYGEFKFSSSRRMSYHDHLTDPHFNYMAGVKVEAIKDVMSISAQCTFPHNIQDNSIEKYKLKLKLNITLSSHIYLALSHEVAQDFKNIERTHINNFTFGYNFL